MDTNTNKGNLKPALRTKTALANRGAAGLEQSEFAFGADIDAERAGQSLFPVGGQYKLLDWFPPGHRATGRALQLSTNREVELTLLPFSVIAGSQEEATGRLEMWGSREWGIRTAIQNGGLEPLRDWGRCEVHQAHYSVTDAPDGVPLSSLPLPVPVAMAVSVLMAVVPALAELHAGGAARRPVVHGGVSLDAIRVVESPEPRIFLSGFQHLTYAGEMRPDGTGPAQPADDILAVGAVLKQLLFSGPAARALATRRASLTRFQNLLSELQAPEPAERPSAERVLSLLTRSAV